MPPRMLLSLARKLSGRACAGSNIVRACTIQLHSSATPFTYTNSDVGRTDFVALWNG